jgi:hypothetical protein
VAYACLPPLPCIANNRSIIWGEIKGRGEDMDR